MICSRGDYIKWIVLATLFLTFAVPVGAQNFKVVSFRQLPSDVSAFISPVRDLNGDDCGLVKVLAPDDFAFSTPLGIVKRIDKVGEIWLYVPRGTKKITIKHPQLGVLRDYAFPSRLDSHMTYELTIGLPMSSEAVVEHLEPLITTVTDTLVVTRVDTVVVRPMKKPVPFAFGPVVSAGVGGKSITPTAGLMLFALKRHGGFVHVSTNFGSIGKTVGVCDKDGSIGLHSPYYSGRTRRSFYMVNAGAMHRLSRRVAIFEGIGYADSALAWELAQSEGRGYVRNDGYSCRGISFEIGTMLTFKRIAIMASVSSINGREWYGSIGIGIRFGKIIKI